MNTSPFTALALFAAFASVACSSAKPESEEAADGATGPCGIGRPTGFPGDQNCILPPSTEEGLQIHVGPKDYTDPDGTWVVQPGGEPTQVYHTYTTNTDERYYFTQKYRMRTGSHHMIISLSDDTTSAEGWTNSNGNIVKTIAGTQHVVEDFPPNGVVADEDKGLARKLEPHTALDIQLHFYDTLDKPILREVWVNLYYKPAAEVTQVLGYMGGFVYPLSIPAHTTTTVGGVCDSAQAVKNPGSTDERVVTLFGHTHSHTTRFLVTRTKADGTTDSVYDSYDWSEGPTYTYNSLIQNPTPDHASKTSGGLSGDLILHEGEKLTYSCDINNDTGNALTFEEKVDTGEMCNLFGTVASQGFPCFDINKFGTGSKRGTGPGDGGDSAGAGDGG